MFPARPGPPRFKAPLAAMVLMLVGVAILISLGTWQVRRLHWKEDLITAINTAYQASPDQNPLTAHRLNDLRGRDIIFDYGAVRGTYIKDASIAIGPRTHQGTPGYHIITPLRLDDPGNTLVLVNRGWVPLDATDRDPPDGRVTFTGTARAIPRANVFTPANDPANGQWYALDPQQIADATGIKTPIMDHVMIYADSNPDGSVLPVPHEKGWMPQNNHRDYALFWFGMALVLVIIYGLRFRVSGQSAGK